jgi:hypothetical protein
MGNQLLVSLGVVTSETYDKIKGYTVDLIFMYCIISYEKQKN